MPPFSKYVGGWLGLPQLLEMHSGSHGMFCIAILPQDTAIKIIVHLIQAHTHTFFKKFSCTCGKAIAHNPGKKWQT